MRHATQAVLRHVSASLAATVFALAIAASAVQAGPAGGLDRIAITLVEQFAAGSLTVDTAQSLAGADVVPQRAGAYWSLSFGAGALVLVLPAEQEPVRQADLTLTREAGLRLSGLAGRFGNWSPQYREKTSSVLFRLRPPQGGEVLAFAGLHTPKPLPGSPVLTIKLRRQ